MHLDNWNSFENSPLNDEKMLELPELVYLFELVILHFVFTCSRLQTWRPPIPARHGTTTPSPATPLWKLEMKQLTLN